MGIISALYAGVSGIKSFSSAIQVIGNNLANVNTTGFKASRVQFGDLLSQNLTGSVSGSQVGRGTRILGINRAGAPVHPSQAAGPYPRAFPRPNPGAGVMERGVQTNLPRSRPRPRAAQARRHCGAEARPRRPMHLPPAEYPG